jgi:hypothetical protein
MSTSIIPYKCKYCNRAYKLKPNYDKHYLLCNTLSISKTSISKTSISKTNTKETLDYVPSLRDMFTLVLELTAKNSQLEQKVEELSKWAESKKKKLNVIDWLNEKYTKNIKYSEWVAGIIITRKHLEAVFNSDMVTGCYEILQNLLSLHISNEHISNEHISNEHISNEHISNEHISNEHTIPIKAFDQKENILFIYNDDNKWEILSQPMFANLINILSKKILTEFLKWQTENKSKMKQDDFSYKYARNVQKIMGGNLTQEQIHTRVKKELYNYLKMNLKNVVEYEFSF